MDRKSEQKQKERRGTVLKARSSYRPLACPLTQAYTDEAWLKEPFILKISKLVSKKQRNPAACLCMCVACCLLGNAAYLQRLSLQIQLPRLLPHRGGRRERQTEREKEEERSPKALFHWLTCSCSLSFSLLPPSLTLPFSVSLPSLQLDCLASAFYSQCLYNIKWWESEEKKERHTRIILPTVHFIIDIHGQLLKQAVI